MTRILFLLVLLGLPFGAHAACTPANAPAGSPGCLPVSTSAAGTDTLMLWKPSLFPNSLRQVSVDNLIAPVRYDLHSSCGAVGDGVADDSGALKTCIGLVNSSYALGKPALIHVTTGIYKITNTNGTMPCFSRYVPGGIQGDGQHKSYILMDGSYSGSLFCWSDAWEGAPPSTIYNPGPFVPTLDAAGPMVRDVTISGTLAANQSGLVFYDNNDHVLIENVDLFFINGPAISVGHTMNGSLAYMRESTFRHVKSWFGGNSTTAAIQFGATGSGTGDIVLDDINIYAFSSSGLTFTAPGSSASIGTFHMLNVRVEGNENLSATGNNINFGLSSDLGVVNGMHAWGTRVVGVPAGKYAISIDGGQRAFDISLDATTIGPTSNNNTGGGGVFIGNAQGISIGVTGASTDQNTVTLSSTSGESIAIQSASGFSGWKYSLASPTPLQLSSPAYVYGIPPGSGKVGTAALMGSGSTGSAIRLTMDGAAANAENCFNPNVETGYAMSIQMLAQDVTTSGKNYAWTLPIAYFSAWSGAGSAAVTLGTPASVSNGSLSGSSVSLTADTSNGCLNLSWTPPTGNTDTWKATATIQFSRVP